MIRLSLIVCLWRARSSNVAPGSFSSELLRRGASSWSRATLKVESLLRVSFTQPPLLNLKRRFVPDREPPYPCRFTNCRIF
jgi:hypothetical protein